MNTYFELFLGSIILLIETFILIKATSYQVGTIGGDGAVFFFS